MSALTIACEEGNMKMVSLLLDCGARPDEVILINLPNKLFTKQWQADEFALIEACSIGSVEIVKKLLDEGANIDQQDEVSQDKS